MNIASHETVLTGRWLTREGRVVADETTVRIEQLIRTHLRELGKDVSGWDVLYVDPTDSRLWELTYPQSGFHGGGPPELRCLSMEKAKEKYGNVVT